MSGLDNAFLKDTTPSHLRVVESELDEECLGAIIDPLAVLEGGEGPHYLGLGTSQLHQVTTTAVPSSRDRENLTRRKTDAT